MSEDMEREELIEIDLAVEFYLRHRDDPLVCFVAIQIHPNFAREHSVRDLMNLATDFLLTEIDTRGTHRLVLADSRQNRRVILMSEIQSVSILAPDKLPDTEEKE